jgi:hypothetical protein
MAAKSTRKKTVAAPLARAIAKKPRPPVARRNANHRAPQSTALYVAVSPLNVAITRDKPTSGKPLGPCADFEQAKSAAIDALIAAIEDAERQLAACKRATTIDELSGT